jgi:tripartite-type tricarboxylate transporter receptor subunit TctC
MIWRSLGMGFIAFVLATALAMLATQGGPAAASSSSYPKRPITLIVAHKPGGPSDIVARVLGKLLTPVLRQPIMIENRPGASGTIAGEYAAQADPDGYTLLMGNTAILAAPLAQRKQPGFNARPDFSPITLIGTQAHALVVNPALPVQAVTQLIQLAQAKPGFVTYASSGHGSASHLAGELFRTKARANLVHVPYNKPGPALQDVVGGHVQMMFAPAPLVANHVRQGRLRALGVATPKRNDMMPEVPTLQEEGLHGFDATTWYGIVAPAGTPSSVIDVLYHSTAIVLEDPVTRKIMRGFGVDAVGASPKAFESYIAGQVPKWSAVIKSIAYTN